MSDMDHETASRIDRVIEAERRARSRVTAFAVSAALASIAPVVLLVTGWPEGLYYVALMGVFGGLVWLQHLAARRFGGAGLHAYAFALANFALLTFTLLHPNPFAEFPLPPAVSLRFGNFIYFFIMLSALAFSFSPALVLWGGVCAAVCWNIGRLWVTSLPGVALANQGGRAADAAAFQRSIEEMLRPDRVDVGVWIQETAVLLVVAGMLAQIVSGSRRLIRRQAALERRGANLARYLPAQMAERMAEADAPFGGDRKAVAAVLFTDVVGFTGWAEGRDPAEVVRLLREVHALTADEVFRAGGVLDKFIGDGAMATFGAASPVKPGEAARRALACAEAILAGLRDLNLRRAVRDEAAVRLSLGLHLGEVVVGDVGAAGRMELASVGDAVNVASRLETLTRDLGCAAAASDELVQAAGGAPAGWRFAGDRALPGRRGHAQVWTRDP